MYFKAAISPALGGCTVVNAGQPIHFDVVLELTKNSWRNKNSWEVELWYGRRGDLWKAAFFHSVENTETEIYALGVLDNVDRLVFTLDLEVEGQEPLYFTLRARANIATPWIWVHTQTGLNDGQILFHLPQVAIGIDCAPYFHSLFSFTHPAVQVKTVVSQVSGVDVFEISAVAPADCWSTVVLGEPLSLERFYALVKLSSPWMGPRQGVAPFKIEDDTLLLGYVRSDGYHVAVLGLSAIDNCTTYIRSDSGKVILKTRNDGEEMQYHHAIVAAGLGDYQKVVNAAFYRARELLQVSSPVESYNSVPDPAWRGAWYDGLSYCTWNALGRELSEARILSALQDLADNGINVSGLIIDDNWQSLDENRLWVEFEANKRFPRGLASTTAEIRRRFPSILHITVWHSIIGYWEGIAPNGVIDQNYRCTTVKWHGGQTIRVVDIPDVERLYDDFYKFLSSSGIDSVKCDDQMSIDEFDQGSDRVQLGLAYQDAMKKCSSRYFSRRVIYCMSHVPSILFHSLLPHDGSHTLFRNSDDFFPDIPDSHSWHIFANALNGIYTHNLNGLPDWDMFKTALVDYASFHAAGRCISGGPIYITDSPGQHNKNVIKLMTAVTTQYQTVTLRPSKVALPVDPFVVFNQNRLLKVSNFCGDHGGSALLAVFNVSQTENTEFVHMQDFRGIDQHVNYIARSHKSGRVFTAGKQVQKFLLILTLAQRDWDFFTAIPVNKIQLPFRKAVVEVGTFGLISALTGVAAILHNSVEFLNGRVVLNVTLKALGLLAFYISDLASRKTHDTPITIAGTPVPFDAVRRSKQEPTILEVDIENAWRRLDLGRYSEVTVTLYLS